MHKKTKIVAGITIAVCVATIVFFVGALYMLSQKKEALGVLAAQIATAKARENELAALVRLVEGTETERLELQTRVLDEEGVIDFLSLIETLSKEQGVSLKTNTLTVSELSPLFESLNASVTLTGSNDAVLHVLEILEALPYQTAIVAASLTNDGVVDEGVWQANIDLAVTKMKKI